MLCPYCLQNVIAFEPLEDGSALRCPDCRNEGVIPLLYERDYPSHPAVPFAMVGNSAHGKTVFIEALITHLEETGMGSNSSFGFVAEDGMVRYRQRLRELREQNRLPRTSNSVFPIPEVTRLSGAALVGGCHLILYDTGGESFETVENLREAGRYVRNCRVVVWIVSLTNFEYPAEWTDRMTVYAQGMASMGANTRDQCLVVALTKGDLLLDRADLPEAARRFLADDTLDPADAFSRLDELSAALAEWLANGPHRNTVNLLRSRFRAVRYCVVSALGSEPGSGGMVVGVCPRGVLAPLYWVCRDTLPEVRIEEGTGRRVSLNLRDALAGARAGALVQLGPHVYELAEPLQLTRPVHVCGDPSGRTVLRGAVPKYLVAVGVRGSTPVRLSRLTIERHGPVAGDVVRVARGTAVLTDCVIRGGVAGGPDAPGHGVVVFGEGPTAALIRCIVTRNAAHGAVVYGTGRLGARECQLTHNGQIGVDAAGAEVTLENCQLVQNVHHGASLRNGGTAVVRACVASNNGAAGIAVKGTVRVTLTENTCERNRDVGIRLRCEAAAEVTNNHCLHNEQSGIAIEAHTTGRVAENECRSNLGDGIRVADQTAAEVAGNDCRANGQNGIRYAGAASGQCAGNVCSGNGRHGLAVVGTGSPTVAGNTAEGNAGSGFHVRETAQPTFARTNTAVDNLKGNFDPPALGRRSWFG